jgi:hypothetical protein
MFNWLYKKIGNPWEHPVLGWVPTILSGLTIVVLVVLLRLQAGVQ